jgi:hypothetical protein
MLQLCLRRRRQRRASPPIGEIRAEPLAAPSRWSVFAIRLLIFVALCVAPPARADELTIERTYHLTAREASYDLDHHLAHAEGDAVLTYSFEGQQVEFHADRIDANPDTRTVSAVGNVTVVQEQNRLFADAVEYDLNHGTGSLTNARGQAQGVYFSAQSLRATPGQLVLTNGTFTTCDRPNPDYHISAREVIVRPGDRVISRSSTVWLKGHRLIRLPTFDVSLKRPQRITAFSPIGGYSHRDGAFAGLHYTILTSGNSSIDLDTRYTTRRAVRAFGRGELAPRWGSVALAVAHRDDLTTSDLGLFAPTEPVRDLTVDRLPEFVVASNAVPLAKWGVTTARVAAGSYVEYPTRARASRAVADLYVQSVPIPAGAALSLRPLVGVRGTWYDTHQHRSALAYGFLADWKPDPNLALRLGFIERSGRGSGPFAFDAVDIARELDLGLAARLGTGWRTEILARRDLHRGSFPAVDVAIIRVAHCLEYGVTWKRVGGEFGIRVGLAQTGPVVAPGW